MLNSNLTWKHHWGGVIGESFVTLPSEWNELWIVFRYLHGSTHFAQPVYIQKALLSNVDNNFGTTGTTLWLMVGYNINMPTNALEAKNVYLTGNQLAASDLWTYINYR